jgi:hypothetical protein
MLRPSLDAVWDMMQWCVPALRQQAGRFASAVLAAKSGEISVRLNISSKEIATMRRTSDLISNELIASCKYRRVVGSRHHWPSD